MITKKASDSCSPNHLKAFIPILWKKWFALLHGISDGEITAEDEDVDETKYGSSSLRDAIKNLRFEASHSIDGFPLVVYKLENPSRVLSELYLAAKKILKEYEKSLSILKRFSTSTQKEFEDIAKECSIICHLKKLYDLDVSVNIQEGHYYTNEKGEQDWCIADYFDTERVKAVYETVSGYCISAIPFDSFYYLINCDDITIEVERVSDRIVPIKGREMSFYVFLIVLMLGRNPYPSEVACLMNEINDEFRIKTWWARHFTSYVKWNSLPEDNAWVGEYTYSDTFDVDRAPKKPNGVSDADRILLKSFLKRETFENIISFGELVKHGFEAYPYDEIGTLSSLACISDNRSTTLHNLFRLLMDETRYLLQTRECNCAYFLSDDLAKDRLYKNGLSYAVLKEHESRLDKIFCGEEIKDPTLLVIDCLDDYKDFVNLADKTIVTRSMIKAIIDGCIFNNRRTLLLIREAIENDKYYIEPTAIDGYDTTVAPSTTPVANKADRDSKTIDDYISEMQSQSYIDTNGVISMAKARFARLLVEKGYVKTAKPWKQVFKAPFWASYAASGQIDKELIQDITKELIWEPYGGKFRVDERGDALSAANLAKSFTDGDGECRKRNRIFLAWYHKCMS